MKGGSFMANTEIFLRNIFGTTRPNIRPLVLRSCSKHYQ